MKRPFYYNAFRRIRSSGSGELVKRMKSYQSCTQQFKLLVFLNLGCEVGQYGDYCKCCEGCQECDIENGKCGMLTFEQMHFKICV